VPLALSTGHQVGLAVTAAVFIAFALASSFLFPRIRPNYPAGGLPAFIVVSVAFFFAMLAAVEVFGVEEETHESRRAAETVTEAEPRVPPTTTSAQPTTTVATRTQPTTTQQTTTAEEKATTVKVTETEFKIALPSTRLAAGRITFDVQNAGKLPHDLAIKGVQERTNLIPAGGSAALTVTLKPGTYELWCTVPGHEAAGMKLDITVT
jgi:uncharacterized cupredoxin-like copper-binding protein